MKKEPFSPVMIGAITAVGLYFVTNLIFNLDPVCWDGWNSPSIGRQGACSHHGGVNRTRGQLALLACVGFGIWAGVRYSKKQKAKGKLSQNPGSTSQPETYDEYTAPKIDSPKPNIDKSLYAPKSIPACPIHGRMMESVDGNHWVCPSASECDYYFKK